RGQDLFADRGYAWPAQRSKHQGLRDMGVGHNDGCYSLYQSSVGDGQSERLSVRDILIPGRGSSRKIREVRPADKSGRYFDNSDRLPEGDNGWCGRRVWRIELFGN